MYRDELRKTLKTYRDNEEWLDNVVGVADTEYNGPLVKTTF